MSSTGPVRIAHEDLRRFVAAVMTGKGMPPTDAAMAPLCPIARPSRPAMAAPTRGANTARA